MARIIFQTKQNSSTYGKPRVYLSCHPSDVNGPVDDLCDEILRISNCVVYRYEGLSIPADEKECLATLSQMQLVVAVCSDAYVRESSPARDFVLHYALENGVPVLPVVQAGVSVEGFNRMCDDLGLDSLHCLDQNLYPGKNQFAEKLKEYLDYFLINDEDVAKIREQFRACIFLSYRKMDVEFARTLMRRIHNLQQYYDVAIWYDNFLVPGRSFEKEIFEAMDKSDLFLLAVTSNITKPNAWGEDNYVVSKEYKEALARHKKIVAAELEEPDRKQLLIKFDSLPACIDAYDDLMLGNALSPLDGKPQKEGRVHDYYIGLAYLNGVDYDVNPKKAFELILSAANAGLDTAMDRLVRMYRSGIAVKRDYQEAIRWQRKLVTITEDMVNEQETADRVHLLCFRLGKLADYLLEQRNPESETIDRRLYELSDKYAQKYHRVDFYRGMSVICNRLGDLRMAEQRYAEAREHYEAGCRVAEHICEEAPSENAIRDFAVSCQKLGEVNRLSGNLQAAMQYYKRSREAFVRKNSDEITAYIKRDLYITEAMMGETALSMGSIEEAGSHFEESLRLRQEVAGELDTDWANRDISVIWEKLGDLYAETSQIDKVRTAYLRSVDAAAKLYDRTALPVHAEELSKICGKAGEYLQNLAEGKGAEYLEEAKQCFIREYQIDKELAQSSGRIEEKRNYWLDCSKLGCICDQSGAKKEAQGFFLEGIEAIVSLAEEDDSPDIRDDLAVLYFNLFRSDPDASQIGYIKKAYHIWYELEDEYPDNETYSERKKLAHWMMVKYK